MVYRAYTSVFFYRACDTPSENWLAPVLLVLVSSAAPLAAFRVVSPILCAALRYLALRSPTAPPTSAFSYTAPMVVAFMMVLLLLFFFVVVSLLVLLVLFCVFFFLFLLFVLLL